MHYWYILSAREKLSMKQQTGFSLVNSTFYPFINPDLINMHCLSRMGYSESKILLKMTKLNSRFFARFFFFNQKPKLWPHDPPSPTFLVLLDYSGNSFLTRDFFLPSNIEIRLFHNQSLKEWTLDAHQK